MRKFFFILFSTCAIIYLLVHSVVGSAPVQRRIFSEIRRALYDFGIDLEIESIEFSAFAPRFFLNHVVIRPLPNSKIYIEEPLAIDKVKIELEPLGLLSRKIVIGEAALFYPKIVLPHADRIYEQVREFLKKKQGMVVSSRGTFKVIFKRLTIADAVFEIASQSPPLAVRSRNIGFSISQSANGQQSITIESKNLEMDRGPLKLKLNKIDVDFDATSNSIRLNRWILEGDQIFVDARGIAKLPFWANGKISPFQISYETRIGLALLNSIPEISVPPLAGEIRSSGRVQLADKVYVGKGRIELNDAKLNGYRIGTGSFAYSLDQSKAILSDLSLQAGEGSVNSSQMEIELNGNYPLKGEVTVKSLTFPALLRALKVESSPVFGKFDGSIQVSGKLSPLQLELLVKQSLDDFHVLDKLPLGRTHDNTVVEFKESDVEGKVSIDSKGIAFHAMVRVLGGELMGSGTIGFDNTVVVDAKGKGLSLTQMKHIAEVPFAGKAVVSGHIEISKGTGKISGSYEVEDAEVAEIVLGKVKGKLQYSDKLLSFDNLELAAIEPIRGNGYVDFRPRLNHYLFQVESRRASIDQVIGVLRRHNLPFSKPTGGELGARITIEGGHDEKGLEVTGTGTARTFEWYGESWLSGNLSFVYRPGFVDMKRVSLLKRSGALDVRGHFEGKNTFLALSTGGIRLEEINYLGKAPLSGRVSGAVRFDGDLSFPMGNGDIKLQNVLFRGTAFPDSNLKIRTADSTSEYILSAAGNRLRARLLRSEKEGKRKSDLLLYFKEYDLAPMLSAWARKDFPSIGAINATGDVALNGVFDNWRNIKGSGTLTDIRMELRDGPLKNEGPIQFALGEGSVRLDHFRLIGNENQLTGEFRYSEKGEVRGELDGKIDLVYLQPFIPGLEFGLGKVGAALRLSGAADEFNLLGNVSLDDGNFRLIGISDDFRSVKSQLTVSQDRINVDRFDGVLGGGRVIVKGDVKINRFRSLIPNLFMQADHVTLKTKQFLSTQFTGDLYLRGDHTPYVIGGRGQLNEVRLTDFNTGDSFTQSEGNPAFRFDIAADAKEKIFVTTDVMDAEFKGRLNLVGNTSQMGLLGTVEGMRGQLLFKETRFTMTTANVKFEDNFGVVPRFNVSGRALVKENKPGAVAQDYEIFLQAIGTPEKYKLRLTSIPALTENEIISLLIFGGTTKSQEGNYVDLGSVIAGQTPFQSKLQNELGVGIKVGTTTTSPVGIDTPKIPETPTNSTNNSSLTPSVKIEKGIDKKTKVSVSTTVGSDLPYKEFRLEHMLNDSFTVNGTAADRSRGTSNQESVRSYGFDFRYHFSFE